MSARTQVFHGRGWTLEVDQQWIDVMSERETPQESWRESDSNGHEHYYDQGYPTLRLVVDREHWCDGHEGLYNHDPHRQIDESHYVCNTCTERVEPATDPPYWPKQIPGMTDAKLSGPTGPGMSITVSLTDDEHNELRDAGDTADDVARRLLSEAPQERILSAEYSSR